MAYSTIKDDKMVLKRQYIVDTIINDIQAGELVIGSALPSLNELTKQFGVSYFTAVAAYQELMSRGIIRSIPRKGYQVATAGNIAKHRIFLFLNEINSFKDILYNSFKEEIGDNGTVDVYFHHFNPKVYQQNILENLGNYTAYVVMPMHEKGCDKALESIPEGKLYILDIGRFPYGQKYPSVCQNFGNDLYRMLTAESDVMKKYTKLILIISYYPYWIHDIREGFDRFCREQQIDSEQVANAIGRKVSKGECYIVMPDDDLGLIVKAIQEGGLKLGIDVGILSYHETPLKAVVANGLTTISTDFRQMGQTMAEMVLNRKKEHIENPCSLIRRKSL
ncbi:MAG: GntR family transcriptional regulator [Bacteroidota bacterium]|nr:GntR family transcriptional regulator [Bacteroidota bacterium]